MRRIWTTISVTAVAVAAALYFAAPASAAALSAATPASAAALSFGPPALSVALPVPATSLLPGGWTPAPSDPFDRDAGVLCDFGVHVQPISDQVMKRTLATYPDGSPRSEVYVGELIDRVTNTSNGRFFDADASGSAVITYGTDGSQTWYVLGPVLVGARAGSGNIPRGLWVIDGVYRLVIDANNTKTLTMISGSLDDVCARIA